MNEELLTQLREVLAKKGVDEGIIEETVAELKGESVEEEPVEEVVEELVEEPVEEVVDEAKGETVEEEPVVEEVATESTEEPVVESAFDPTELYARLDEYKGEIDELKKANEGLLARISALEEGLSKAGVIDEAQPTANTERGSESAPSTEDLGNPMDNFMAKVKANKRY